MTFACECRKILGKAKGSRMENFIENELGWWCSFHDGLHVPFLGDKLGAKGDALFTGAGLDTGR